jgi:virginiamycin B lyase
VEYLEDRALLTSCTEYPLPALGSSSAGPFQIVTGPDGNLWATDLSLPRIYQVTTSGKATVYPIASNHSSVAITSGPDGALWFTEYPGIIGRITTSGQITEFKDSANSNAGWLKGIVTGPDGALWFTDYSTGAIGRITTSGGVTEYPLPNASKAGPDLIAAGPDGALWYTDETQGLIGRITTSGQIAAYQFHLHAEPQGIVTGPDGNLWVSESDDQHIAMVAKSGVSTEFSIQTPGKSAGSKSYAIIAGPDKNLYFTEGNGALNGVGAIGQITTAGVAQHFSTNITNTSPAYLTTGPDGNIWFTDDKSGEIGVLSGISAPTPTPTPTPMPTPTPTPTPTPGPTSGPGPTSTSTPTRTPMTPAPAAPPRPSPKLPSALPSSKPWFTRTFLSIKPRSMAFGQRVILTAKVADLSRPQLIPIGTALFMAGDTSLGLADLQAGKATLTTGTLPAGRVRVRVVYLGTTDFRQSRSAISIERVGARRAQAPPGDHSRNIAATTSQVPLRRRQVVLNADSGALSIAAPDVEP